jgi:hypothetical protein
MRRRRARFRFFIQMVSMTRNSTSRSHAISSSVLGTAVLGSLLALACLYAGFLLGVSTQLSCTSEADIQKRVRQKVREASLPLEADDTASRFPVAASDFATGAIRVGRDDFSTTFDMGVPLDESSDKNGEVLIIYNSANALPNDPYAAKEAVSQTGMPLMSAKEATENCDFLNAVLTDHSSKGRRQCIALFGQYEAFHIQKWMRLPEHGKLEPSAPLRLVNRGAQPSGRKSTRPPSTEETLQYWSILTKYLSSLESVLAQLRPIAQQVAVNNTIVVLVCNFGQSELLVNFVCSSRSRNLDLSLLVFATDQETYDLAIAHGIGAFYDETNFENMPKEAAGRYADATFTKMMLAKVYCVQMISMLGFDVLFQDVDLLWYRNPLDFFHDIESPLAGFDAYFQDDGNHGLFYAPYSANTGFYYIRNNDKTRHFFNSFLMAGDLIFATHSHQVPLVALLSEHASMYGLRVKIFSRTENDWPGGHAFHRRNDFMKDVLAGVAHPYIFHMSWTHSKENKIRFFQQFGEWYVQDKCIQETVGSIGSMDDMGKVSKCCTTEAIVTCHYRDKPSKVPCRDSPPIDKDMPSFW